MPGTIAYVWGGCSLTEPYSGDQFEEINVPSSLDNKQAIGYQYIGSTAQPKTGFDCSGLILRAAQIAGMPYYYKNSTTIATHLKPIDHFSDIKDGDLIWIPWHIMAIGDLKRNIIIEARHYNDGYGKLHAIKLNKLFKDINTFADLFNAIAQKKTLYRLDKIGYYKSHYS